MNKDLDHPTYLQTCAAAKIKTSVSFMDRRDLLDYINGVSANSAHIAKPQKAAAPGSKATTSHSAAALTEKSATASNELAKIFGFDLAAKRAALPASVRDDFQVMKKLKMTQRTINTTSNILSIQNSTKVFKCLETNECSLNWN